jgi:CDP-diacylglycerol--serine O-phosphatidyltransferase
LVPLLAILMVSNVRYRSFKEYNLKRTNSFYVLIGAAVVIGIIAINPNVVLFLGFLTYVLSGPVTSLFSAGEKKKPVLRAQTGRKLSVVELQKKEE